MTKNHQMNPLPDQYDTPAIEKKWQEEWARSGVYAWDKTATREECFVIDTPPPTVSGHLHMGHVFSYTQADFIARYQRMTGKSVFYPMGFDDNGLPTERLVEKTKKIRAVDMTREAFIAQCLEVSEEARRDFRALFESIALSVDWAQEYHTISDSSRRLSQLSFLDLVNKGHAYRAERPFYWDPVDQTAIAQAEIVDKELPSFQNTITFTIEGEPVNIMTTRPELLPACVALFCHPEDARYAKYKGKHATVPLFGHQVPVLEDETVESEKGTGIMMCCTFGDEADIQKWQKHKLPIRMVLNKFGKLDFSTCHSSESWNPEPALLEALTGKKVSNPDPKYLGAREILIQNLKDAGLLTEQKPITHAVKTAERSGAPLEILPTQQWFVRVLDKKSELLEKTRACNWNPEWMRLRMEQWIDGLNQDWCISRQRYFGVPFPVWYVFTGGQGFETGSSWNPTNKFIVARPEELPVNPMAFIPRGFKIASQDELNERKIALSPQAIRDGVKVVFAETEGVELAKEWGIELSIGDMIMLDPDMDVMDTWATSSISPQLSAGAISESVIPAQAGISSANSADSGDSRLRGNDEAILERFHKLYPADLRPQAHEIIRTWAFYTIVKSYLHTGNIPWKDLMISGWCLAEDKSKMSKSKGNVITPVDLIKERGTDAVRYWAATSRLGTDTAFSPDLLKIGKKLTGKLWNATIFAAIHLSKLDQPIATAAEDMDAGIITEALDRWILSRLGETVARATKAYDAYEYADALDATNQFFWADFCDNYLELVKRRAYNEDGSTSDAAQQSAVRTLYYCLETILKLYAPVVPHVTEELYTHIFAPNYTDEFKRSIHSRYQWPRNQHYRIDEDAIATGRDAVEILEAIRKTKSDAKKSIKFPVRLASIAAKRHYELSGPTLDSLSRDLQGAGNVETLNWDHTTIPASVAASLEIISIELSDAADAA